MILDEGYVHGGDIYSRRITLDFSANVNPLGTPEAVREAVRASAERIDIYPDLYCAPLRERLAELNGVEAGEILCGNGAAELIYQFAAALKPENALLPVPSFADYEAALTAAGCSPRYYPLLRSEGFAVTERILKAIDDDTDLLMLCSPNNPTGRVIKRPLLLRILERCWETGTWLFLDECFLELTDEERAFSLASSLRPGDRVILLRAFTKAYGMAGVRLGYAISRHPGILSAMCRGVQAWNVSTPAQAAGLAALDCPAWPERARRLIRTEKKYLTEKLKALGISVLPGDANYLMLSGVPGLYDALLAKGILIRDCRNYRGLGEGDCRIAVRAHEENKRLIEAIREVRHG